MRSAQRTYLITELNHVFSGGYVVLCPVVLADLFGTDLIAQSMGLWLFACGLAGSIASPIGGKSLFITLSQMNRTEQIFYLI